MAENAALQAIKDAVAARHEETEAEYARLVQAVANGQAVDTDTAIDVMAAAGWSFNDFAKHVHEASHGRT